MGTFTERRKQALEACEKVITGIEDGTISVSSSLLMCMRIARLVNDLDGQEWLNYEYGGYPLTKDGHVVRSAWDVAAKHGRSYTSKVKDGPTETYIFTSLCAELEQSVASKSKAVNNFSTQGYSVSGEMAVLATNNFTRDVTRSTYNLLNDIQTAERNLAKLKSQYYDYAVRWQIELQFGNVAQSVFEAYQTRVDEYFSKLPTTVLQKLNAIEDLLEDENPEHYAQVLTSCRRLWSETAKVLFEEVLPGYTEKTFTTKSGTSIDVSGDHDNNKLSAVIETLQSKSAKNTLVGSEIIYLVNWIEQINNRQSAGVHGDVSREQAQQCVIQTYIALGDILSLKETAANTHI